MLEGDPASWLRFITSEIWCRRRSERDESIFEGARDASQALKIRGDQQ